MRKKNEQKCARGKPNLESRNFELLDVGNKEDR